jgi:diadenosine tetraphosphate (Ap4A) HIT family hydrolase
MRTWDADWEARRAGQACPMCAEGRPDEAHGNARIFAGRVSDAYLVRGDVGQPGYTIVIWRGSHVADPTELSDADATTYFREVLTVARALEGHYRPAKLNFEMLGNTVPHLHTHVIPRYVTDDSPGEPARMMRLPELHRQPIPDEIFHRDVAALRVAFARMQPRSRAVAADAPRGVRG